MYIYTALYITTSAVLFYVITIFRIRVVTAVLFLIIIKIISLYSELKVKTEIITWKRDCGFVYNTPRQYNNTVVVVAVAQCQQLSARLRACPLRYIIYLCIYKHTFKNYKGIYLSTDQVSVLFF
jgi:hypothetical protein